MRILSLRRGFDADHSSSTYEFFARDRLTPEQCEAVQDLTGESPRRHLHFHYWGDRSLPSGWQDKLLTLGQDPDLLERLGQYECDSDGNGFGVRLVGERMVLDFGMQLDYGAMYDMSGEDPFEGLADLFEAVREELLANDLSAVWAMYETYGGYGDVEPDPVEPLSDSGNTLLSIMENY
jgi:hypothetical protein